MKRVLIGVLIGLVVIYIAAILQAVDRERSRQLRVAEKKAPKPGAFVR